MTPAKTPKEKAMKALKKQEKDDNGKLIPQNK